MGIITGLNDNDEKKKEPYYGDLEKTGILAGLFEVPVEQRDGKWQSILFDTIAHASFRCGDPQIIAGPDGFPYFQLLMPVPNQPFTCYTADHVIKDFLMEHGFGLVINPDKGNPDWVFSYGDVLNYFLKDAFYSEAPVNAQPGKEVLEKNLNVLAGQPSEAYLPSCARTVMRNALNRIGINDAKIFLMQRKDSSSQELVFNITPERFSEDVFNSAMQVITWHLPRHYSVCGMAEEGQKESFELL